MLNPELFIDEAHEHRLGLLAERLRLAGFTVPDDPTEAGGAEVEAKKTHYAPGVFMHWYVRSSKSSRSGWEVRDPAEEEETP